MYVSRRERGTFRVYGVSRSTATPPRAWTAVRGTRDSIEYPIGWESAAGFTPYTRPRSGTANEIEGGREAKPKLEVAEGKE